MKLRIKDLSFVTGGAFVSIMNSTDAREIDLHPGDRILISMNNKKIISVVDLSEDEKIKKGEIGLFDEILDYLKTRKGYVNVKIAKRLKSLGYIKKKLEGKKLNRKEIFEIIKDINSNNLNEVELTYFVSGCYSHGLSMHEIEDMTDAIVKAGHRLKLKKHPIVDKHCIGGVPGNRTTMIVVPIIASLGITMPKTSSRAISSPAGTSDTMEALANVSFEVNEIKRIVEKINGCIVWGGVVDLASADDKMIKVRNPLRLDPEGLLLASIMAKKKAVNASHVLIDIPIGKNAKIERKKEALKLKRRFIELGKDLSIKVKVIITDGKQPIGNGIGPVLEARDVLNVLMGNGPMDLRKKGIRMAAEILRMLKIKNPKKKALDSLNSGKAYEKMKEIIKAQKGHIFRPEQLKLAKFNKNIHSTRSGIVKEINNKDVSKIARTAGAPVDKKAGIYLNKKLRDKVKKDELLFTVYASSQKRLNYALELVKERNPYVIS
ncbi:AMP phosphorylase [Candidatus Woesearchaeota archaeon]|uniref:AMP phosphorylase n=1 Tax=uncultured Candidatus Woesearchaeota archaeon TaxID=2014372 RepID=A0A447IU18_9ARCH|nr:AMP phosphorylase [Candidatus Woesearchaeota archaeon]VDS11003.1 AMP phosphorylase [uncultured Candidatus Woesearchaeota archaeon]